MTQKLGFLFICFIIGTIAVYVLRGIGVLTLIPGGVIWLLLLLTAITGILYNVARVNRLM